MRFFSWHSVRLNEKMCVFIISHIQSQLTGTYLTFQKVWLLRISKDLSWLVSEKYHNIHCPCTFTFRICSELNQYTPYTIYYKPHIAGMRLMTRACGCHNVGELNRLKNRSNNGRGKNAKDSFFVFLQWKSVC